MSPTALWKRRFKIVTLITELRRQVNLTKNFVELCIEFSEEWMETLENKKRRFRVFTRS